VFKGLPIPSAGIVVASFPLMYWYSDKQWIINLLLNKWFWYILVIVLSWLMVSRIPLLSLKFKNISVKNNLPKYVLVIIAIIAALTLHWAAIPVIIAAYIIVSLLFKNKLT
jgi:CDP-diacylglycerol---serine O-phosphatidyltransferase